MFEERWTYFPEPWPAGAASEPDDVLVDTEDGERLHGWCRKNRDTRGWILYFHGNAGNLFCRRRFVDRLAALPANVLAIDYRGFGRSTGRPNEAGLYRDADAAWRWLVEDRGVDPARIVGFGKSLGGGVAIELASRRPLGGLAVQSTFTDGWDMAALKMRIPRWFVRRLCRNTFDSMTRIAAIPCPKLVIHASGDRMIPVAMGRRLYEAASPPKRFLELGPLDHDAVLDAPPAWDEALRELIGNA